MSWFDNMLMIKGVVPNGFITEDAKKYYRR